MTDEDEEDIDDFDDDEEEPSRPSPVMLSRKDLTLLITGKFSDGWDTFGIHKWLTGKNLADERTGVFLTLRQIAGIRALLRHQKRRCATLPPKPQPPAEPQPQRPPVERDPASILRHLKRLVQFAANGDDPVLKARAIFKVCDEEDKKASLFQTMIGLHRLIEVARCVLREHSELSEYAVYIMAGDSSECRSWITKMFNEIELQARRTDIKVTEEEAAEMLETMESRIGFRV
jgi:hypothetical protein